MLDVILALPLLELHIAAVFSTLALVIIADIHGLLWVLGRLHTLPLQRMILLHRLVSAGLIITIIAGALMFVGYAPYLVTLWAFRIKMLFVLMLVVNAFVIKKHLHIAAQHPFADLPHTTKITLVASGIVSSAGWVGALIAAQFLGL